MIIAAWVIGGSPQGNPGLLPKPTAPSALSAEVPPLRDALTLLNKGVVQTPLRLAGIRPLTDAPVLSAKLTAQLPDGSIQPLVWLYRFDPKSLEPRQHGAFTFRKPLDLPAGTLVQSSSPLRFALETETIAR